MPTVPAKMRHCCAVPGCSTTNSKAAATTNRTTSRATPLLTQRTRTPKRHAPYRGESRVPAPRGTMTAPRCESCSPCADFSISSTPPVATHSPRCCTPSISAPTPRSAPSRPGEPARTRTRSPCSSATKPAGRSHDHRTNRADRYNRRDGRRSSSRSGGCRHDRGHLRCSDMAGVVCHCGDAARAQ